MKAGTENLAKFRSLCERLSLPKYAGIGLLQALWRFAETKAPAGDIGRFTDDVIARDVEWRDDSTELVTALVDTGWLDRHRDPAIRLSVHDWHEHCEDRIHRQLARRRLLFVDGWPPNLSRLAKNERECAEAFYADAHQTCAREVRLEHAHQECAPTVTITNTREGDMSPCGSADADPLAPFPALKAFYPQACDLLRTEHPKAKLPKPGTRKDLEARDTVAKLVRLDGYTEADVIACLRWLFTAEHADAVFWRQNVLSLAPLRRAKDGASKYAKIHEAWARTRETGTNHDNNTDPELSHAIAAAMGGSNTQ